MCDVQHREAVVDEPSEQSQDLSLDADVEAGRRLIEDQDLWCVRERDRQADPLLLAAAQLVGIAPCERRPSWTRRAAP